MAKKQNDTSGNINKDNPKDSPNVEIKFPKDFDKKIKIKFDKIKNIEIQFPKFLEIEKQEFQRLNAIKLNLSTKYQPRPSSRMTPCGNGDFEGKIDTQQWQGAYGDVRNIPGSFTEGFISGPIGSSTSHQTWVPTAVDSNVPISTTAPSSNGAIRIGNSVNGYGSELISKTFVVTPNESTIIFWYAVVMQNPIGHPPSDQPLFWVRVTDASGVIVPGAFDFGGGSDKLIADKNNPFFKSKDDKVYRDWSCAQIDLSTQIGKQVTIEFISGDCGYGGHWGYAYIDRYCGTCEGSPTGTIDYDCDESDHCGLGKICFDYTLPQTEDDKGNTVTGNVEIQLDIYQNGNLLTTLNSPILGKGSQFCFIINPTSLPGINLALGGFDFVATGKFSIASLSLGSKKIGTKPTGITPGQNNDYQIECKSCSDIEAEQEAHLQMLCDKKVNKLEHYNCNCPDSKDKASCGCTKGPNDPSIDPSKDVNKIRCIKAKLPKLEPCISISWGDSPCDCFETNDYEVACITVCNCYENVSFDNFVINKLVITDEFGKPVDTLPNGKPSVQVVPSGPICFGEIPPCTKRKVSCKSREIVIKTVGAKSGKYRLKLYGVCYETRIENQKEICFDLSLCGD